MERIHAKILSPDSKPAHWVAVVGPTGSGKTDLAILLAREFNGEIVSADSRQIYKFLNAGTAKPLLDGQARFDEIPYHLVDFLDPKNFFDAGTFATLAKPLLSEIRDRKRLPIIAGGTGLYLKALSQGLSSLPKADDSIRAELLKTSEEKGRLFLHQELEKIDPIAANKIPANNIQRVIRALEVYKISGRPISDFWKQEKINSEEFLTLRIEWPVEVLKQRLKERCLRMWPQILQETARLVPKTYSGEEPGFQSLGYPQAVQCLQGKILPEKGLSEFIKETLAYAKRQRTWFKHQIKGPVFDIAGQEAALMFAEAASILRQWETL